MATRRRWLIALGVSPLAAVGLGAGYAVFGSASRKAAVDAVQVENGDVTQTVSSVSASVQPRVEVTVASQASGRLVELRARLGQRVREGDIVAVVAAPVLEAELSQAAVDVARAQRNLERMRALGAWVPPADLETADFDFKAAAAKLATLQARRKELTICAPISGTVTAEHAKPGEVLGAASEGTLRLQGFPIVSLATLDDLVVKAYVDDADILSVHQGQEALTTVDALPGATFTGGVSSVAPAPAVRAMGTTYEVVVAFRQSPARLVAGVRASVRVVVARAHDVILVPKEAVFPCAAGRCVFVVEAERARQRRVETEISDATHAGVRSGLRVGERVLVSFPESLRDGARIALRQASR